MPVCNPYLHFDGTAAQALALYQRVLGGETSVLTYGQMPPGQGEPPPGCAPIDPARVMHGQLNFDGGLLMCSDAPNPSMVEPVGGFAVTLTYPDADAARRVFDQLAEGAQSVTMPFGPTFWAKGFGMVKDRFGTPWIINGGMIQP